MVRLGEQITQLLLCDLSFFLLRAIERKHCVSPLIAIVKIGNTCPDIVLFSLQLSFRIYFIAS